MTIDGFSVNLGQASRSTDLKALVNKESIADLLELARKDSRFNEARDQYEFRLRRHGNQAVLELRRKTTTRFIGAFSKGRRSGERAAALDAIRQHFSALSPRRGESVRLNEARSLSKEFIDLHELTETNAASVALYRLSPGTEALRSSLDSVMEYGRKDQLKSVAEPELEVRRETLSLLNRANVAVDDFGRLRIRVPGQAGNGEANLQTIHQYFMKQSGPSTDPAKVRQMVEAFLLQVRSGSDRAIGALVESAMQAQFKQDAIAGTPQHFEIAVRVSGSSVRLNLIQSAQVNIGPAGMPLKTLPFAAKLECLMPVDALLNAASAKDPQALFQDLDFHIASTLEDVPNTADDNTDDQIRGVRQAREQNRADLDRQRMEEEASRLIPRGPRKLQPGIE